MSVLYFLQVKRGALRQGQAEPPARPAPQVPCPAPQPRPGAHSRTHQRVPLGHGPRHLVEAAAAALGTGRREGEREGGMEGGGSVAAPAAEW